VLELLTKTKSLKLYSSLTFIDSKPITLCVYIVTAFESKEAGAQHMFIINLFECLCQVFWGSKQ
jgi:hypothetical protein